MEKKGDDQNPNNSSSSSFVIQIPSYQEVNQTSQSKQSPFTPSQSFTQAFNSIKNSKFYAPPPPPFSSSSQFHSSTSRGDSTTSSLLPSAPENTTGTTSSSTQNRNAILVSYRQVRSSIAGMKEADLGQSNGMF